MKRVKAFLAFLLTVVMILTLGACDAEKEKRVPGGDQRHPTNSTQPSDSGSEPQAVRNPTARELLDKMPTFDMSKYYSIEVSMGMDGRSDDTEASLQFDACMEGTPDIAHMYDAAIDATTEMFSLSVRIESWMDLVNQKSYDKASFMGEHAEWTVSDMESSEGPADTFIELYERLKALQDSAKEFNIQERTDKEDYTVVWSVSAEDLQKAMETADAISGGTGSIDYSAIDSVEVKAVFSWSDNVFKSITVYGAGDGGKLNIKFGVYDINSDVSKLKEIPAEVIKNAVSDDNFGGVGVGGDDDFGISNQENPSGDSGSGESDARYRSDGQGYDEALDDTMVNNILSSDSNADISVNHYGEVNSLSWEHDSTEWYGSVSLDHVAEENTWYSMQDEFNFEFDFWAEQSDDITLVSGSKEEGKAVFMYVDGDAVHLHYTAMQGDYYVEAHACQYSGGNEYLVMKKINGMLSIIGL